MTPAHPPHSSVLPDDSRASRQRTRVVRRSLSPMFNHTMVYDGFGPADLRQACAELSLWDHGALTSRQLGGTRLSLGTGKWGPNAEREGLSVWLWAPLCPLLSFGVSLPENWEWPRITWDQAGSLGPGVSCDHGFHPCLPYPGSSYGLQVPWMDSTPEEKQLWQTLLERPCEWVDGLLPLRTNLAPRT